MNFVFLSKSKKKKSAGYFFIFLAVVFSGPFLVLGVASFRERFRKAPDLVAPAEIVLGGSFSKEQAIRPVSDSFGIPYEPVVRLSEFLGTGNFSGVGLFRVKPGHLSLLEDRFVPGAMVDLEDPVMNANIALGLLAGFHNRGYSWEQCFLIYVFGWSELAPATRSVEAQEFLDFVFGGGR
jgi:hypothetical protein